MPAVAGGFSLVEIFVDGANLTNGGYQRIAANNTDTTPMITNWGLSLATTLSAGSHTIQVRATSTGAGSDSTISGDNTSVLQGELTVLLLKL